MKKLTFAILLLLFFSGIAYSQVSVTDNNIIISNDAGGNTSAIKLQGTNQNNSIEFSGLGQVWKIFAQGDQSLSILKSSGTTFMPFRIFNTTFADAFVLAEHGVGIGTTSPQAVLHVDHGTGDAANLGLRTGSVMGYLNVQRPSGNTSSISRWKDNDTTVVIIDGHDSTYQMTVYGDALASGGSWQNSDRKLKSDIKNLDGAIEKIKLLKPRYYSFNRRDSKYSFLNLPEEKQIGFIAQDVEKVLPEAVRKSVFIDGDGDQPVEHELYAMNYSAIIPVLTGAIQEQQEIIEKLQSEIRSIETLKLENEALIERLNKIEERLNDPPDNESFSQLPETINNARLEQNIPNPFRGTTRIKYFIPETSRSASVVIHNQAGQPINEFDIQHTGNGEIEFRTNGLATGQYSYTLIVNGIIVDTKMMVISG